MSHSSPTAGVAKRTLLTNYATTIGQRAAGATIVPPLLLASTRGERHGANIDSNFHERTPLRDVRGLRLYGTAYRSKSPVNSCKYRELSVSLATFKPAR
jgi:hypothetical protein